MYILSALVGLAVMVLTGLVVRDSAFDLAITQWFNEHITGFWRDVTNSIYAYLEPVYSVTLTIVIGAVMALFSWRKGLAFPLSVGLAWVPILAFKAFFDRQRPPAEALLNAVQPTSDPHSFPSGHTAYISVLFIMLMLFTGWHALKWLVPVGIAVICAVVFTEGVHFPTDAAASVIWAATVAPGVHALAWRFYARPESAGTDSTASHSTASHSTASH